MKISLAIRIALGAIGSDLAMRYVSMRGRFVECTNGHALLRMPVDAMPTWIPDGGLINEDTAQLVSIAGIPNDQGTGFLVGGENQFPKTDKLVNETRNAKKNVSILVDPKYLELIGKSMRMAGENAVRIEIQGDRNVIYFQGFESKAEAFLMPRI